MRPEVWPYRVGVRMFKHKRAQNTWSSQSGQTGGNVQPGTAPLGSQPSQHHGHRHHRPQPERRFSVIETSNQFSALDTDMAKQFGN